VGFFEFESYCAVSLCVNSVRQTIAAGCVEAGSSKAGMACEWRGVVWNGIAYCVVHT
jgi:hypothetical protein